MTSNEPITLSEDSDLPHGSTGIEDTQQPHEKVPLENLTTSERDARISQLPSVEYARANSQKSEFDPENPHHASVDDGPPAEMMDPPEEKSGVKFDPLTPSERVARVSQLPAVDDVKANPSKKFDPDDHLSPSERQARVSLVPSLKELKTSLRDPNRKRCRWFAIFSVLALVVAAVVIAVLVTTGNNKDEARTDEVLDLLADNQISTVEDLFAEGSPQNEAAVWIAKHDKLAMPVGMYQAFIDRYVLAVLYFALGGDEKWPQSLNFLSAVHVCNWWEYLENQEDASNNGEYSPLGGVFGCIDVEGELVPTGISLPYHGLTGQLPDEIRHLKYLKAFLLQNNDALAGELPTAFAALSDLGTLSLQHCSLSGSIPRWIGNMKKLSSLDLGHNRFSGTVPESIKELTNLVQLGLDDNIQLEGDISMFSALTDLRFLFLEGNQFTGTLSTPMLLENWKQMEILDLSNNKITSKIPVGVFQHESLRVLDLHSNLMTGFIPEVYQEANTRLELLALQNNQLQSEIPRSISLLRSLRHLDLSGNSLGSTIPREIGSMINLRSLFLGNNVFTPGPIPSFLSRDMFLEELSLPGIRLTGTIPNTFGSELRYLDLSKNELVGTIPEDISEMGLLQYLLLRDNRLVGSLSSGFSKLSNLDGILLEGNRLTGALEPLCHQGEIEYSFFASDCGGDQPEVSCSCCTICCSDADDSCNDLNFSANLDPDHEYDYVRDRFDFVSARNSDAESNIISSWE